MQNAPIEEIIDEWKIESMMNDSETTRNLQEQQNLLNVASESMLSAMHHEKLIQSKGHSSKFVRSSKLSNKIAHTSYMAKAIETTLLKERIYSGTKNAFNITFTAS